ncbi:PREDICTED: acyl-CoA--sterol O-acyltransferase 1-like [Lupinus angustifolius]|uniref:acyl-CoA--sterol O-acyltransferase 1-like n=1 Tax=Lupinus angustifolius TaxID=3871 RepID=UPI00092F7BEA|nr:PREDICTED: acyl-CoA--sterol O-acyltransferase 1-like [Lupinus angustifolius]
MIPTNAENSPLNAMNNGQKSRLNYTIKVVTFIGVIKAYDYTDYNIHNMVLYILYSLYLYLILEIILAIFKVLARTLLGIEFEPPFDEPCLASSLQDFWSRRWNLVVVNTLRLSIYEPTKKFALPIIGRKWASYYMNSYSITWIELVQLVKSHGSYYFMVYVYPLKFF